MMGTASQEQGRRREVRPEGSWRQKPDATNRNRIQGRVHRVNEHWIVTPHNHPEMVTVNPARPGGKRRVLPWEACVSVTKSVTSVTATLREGCAGVSRGHSTPPLGEEGPNRSFKESVLFVSMDVERQ